MKKSMRTFTIILLLAIFSVLVVSCGTVASSNTDGPNPVHMSDTKFLPEKITIKKGEVITIINDGPVVHVIGNGTWDENGTQRPNKEEGAPTVEANMRGYQVQEFGPFNTTGTFEIYCLTHVNMNLTVVVEDL